MPSASYHQAARCARKPPGSVVCESDSGQGFDWGQSAWALGRDKCPTPVGIGVHDRTATRGLAIGAIADPG